MKTKFLSVALLLSLSVALGACTGGGETEMETAPEGEATEETMEEPATEETEETMEEPAAEDTEAPEGEATEGEAE